MDQISPRTSVPAVFAAGLLLTLAAPLWAWAQPTSPSFFLAQDTVGAAGQTMTSPSHRLDGTLAQPGTVGETSSASWVVQSGFWTQLSTRRVVRISGAGSGRGMADGEGVSCALDAGIGTGDCSQSFTDGEVVHFVATPDPSHAFDAWTGCDATVTTTLPEDTCEVTVGAGRTITARFTALGTVAGRVWRDVDGVGDQDPNEPGLDGIAVTLSDDGSFAVSTVTAGGGLYAFSDIYPDTLQVEIDPGTLPAGSAPSFDPDGLGTPHVASVVLGDGATEGALDFGYQPQTNLRVTKVDDVDPLPGGETLTYTITVENLGPGIATQVRVLDVIPAETTLVETIGCVEDPVGAPTCTLGALGVGNSASYTLEVSIDPAPPATITNTATVSSLEVDLDGGDNADDETTALDAVPPGVSAVGAVPPTDDGELASCETVHGQEIEALTVAFSEPMADPPGHGTPGDVTNPASYFLVAAGPDAELQTMACGALAGDDVEVAVDSVLYDPGSNRATLVPDSSFPPALFRLFACGSGGSALTDVGGTPLDGDADGTAGGDFVRRFRSDPANLLGNGHFDCGLDGWSVEAEPGEVEWASEDLDASGDSGSLRVQALGSEPVHELSRCAALPGATDEVWIGGWFRLETDASGVGVALGCTFFGDDECSGTASPPAVAAAFLADTAGAWVELSHTLLVPPDSASAWCSAELTDIVGSGFDGRIDQIRLVLDATIFSDGFESGDTSAWTTAVP